MMGVKEQIMFGIKIILDMKVMAIKIETYQMMNTLTNWILLEKHNN